jgi:inner membrane protein involved in colicin E2 resistance
MKKVILILLIVLGIADFLYGIFYQDRISIIAGAGIVLIALYITKAKTSATAHLDLDRLPI